MANRIRTAGEMRGLLADVLADLRAKRMTPDEANAIAKVAGEITKSLAVEVQTALQAGMKDPVPGSMVIASDIEPTANEPPKNITENITSAPAVSQVPAQPKPKIPEVCPPARGDGDKIWCDQCDMQVTVGQAVACKSRHCKAKEAA